MSKMQTALVKSVLERWQAFDWTVQGFGMVRTKIADVGRIHIWDSRLRVPLVSDVHAHPWNFRSTIISGELHNQRFNEGTQELYAIPYTRQAIATGEGGGLVSDPVDAWLVDSVTEFYYSGESYEQSADEIHRSMPQDGTVTLMERTQGPPLQETVVYWPRGTSWVSAEPKKAESWQIERAVTYALARWNV
jgi:hypothetical protein